MAVKSIENVKLQREAALRAAQELGEGPVRDVLLAAGYSEDQVASLLTAYPEEPKEDGTVVTFRAFNGYAYAAIRCRGMWFVTQDATTSWSLPRMRWEALVDHFTSGPVSPDGFLNSLRVVK